MTERYGVTRVLSSILAAGLVVRRLTNHDTAHTMRVAAYTEPHGLPARDTQKQSAVRKPFSGVRSTYQLLVKAIRGFLDDDCTTMAAALAYYTTFSISPLLLIVISIVGLVFGRQAVQHQIQAQIQDLIG
ncbi:MAG TPA: YhjD/YihY/BrkB family envelope integrity protein, partial [Bryobacteraceae bacterium]